MPILAIRHVTTYRYRQPVAFGEHRMMLRPRDDGDQTVLELEIVITPEPIELAWSQDRFGNHVATARFEERAAELRFESTIRVDHAPAGFEATDIEAFARRYPFACAADDGLAPFLVPLSADPKLHRWVSGFLRGDGSADTADLLVGMTKTIKRTFRHVQRHEPGIQDPLQTLELGSGSCRDVALLMIAALRSLGIAARFVSGYLNVGSASIDGDRITGGNTHAWVQAYVPGSGLGRLRSFDRQNRQSESCAGRGRA